ncbi:MAG: folylpolyglutamate synthase/dihydrofolate synthase family protein [Acidobacteriota bacterium]
MDYRACLEYLDRLGNEVLTMKFGLETTRRLLARLGNPHQRFATVLVAGTNGKGSVAHFLAGICSAAGLRTGLFTSPHLVEARERIRVDGVPVAEAEFAAAFEEVVECIRQGGFDLHPTFFETITATALCAFRRHRVELAVLEVGMGGRLDSTNAVEPLLSLITPIDYDHQKYLGHTLSAIAREKAGIIRGGRPVLSSVQQPEVAETLRLCAAELGAQLSFVAPPAAGDPDWLGRYEIVCDGMSFRLGSCGRHQVANAALAAAAASRLAALGLPITPAAVAQGLRGAVVPGVLQWWSQHPPLILDGGHNPHAARNLAEYLQGFTREPRTLIFGCMQDKDAPAILRPLLPLFDRVLFTRVRNPRAASTDTLRSLHPAAEAVEDPLEALDLAARFPGTTVVAGSFYLVGEVLRGLTEPERTPKNWLPLPPVRQAVGPPEARRIF